MGKSLLCMYPCAGSISMHLASDYIHPYKDAAGRPARCRVRIYLPDDMRDNFMVICSQLADDSNTSVTNMAEYQEGRPIIVVAETPGQDLQGEAEALED